jgi:hypothetical protein
MSKGSKRIEKVTPAGGTCQHWRENAIGDNDLREATTNTTTECVKYEQIRLSK